MAESQKKMSLALAEDGTFTYAFEGCEPLTFHPRDFAATAIAYLTTLGVKTGARNSTIGQEKGSVGSPAEMRDRMASWVERMKAGVLRIVTAGGDEKAAAPTLLLEAASIYKAMSACFRATGDVEGWEAYDRPEPESLRSEVEGLDDVITNPEAVEKARAAALEKGDDEDAAAKKAAITQLDVLKRNKIFALAYVEARERRDAAKKAAIKAAIKAEQADQTA